MSTLGDLIKQTAPFAKERPFDTWIHLITTAMAMVVSILLTTPLFSLWIRIPASIMTGLLFIRFFMFYHDHLHGSILAHSKPGKIIMWLYGIFILNPPTIWRVSHNYHHRSNSQIATASIGSFPVMTVKQYNDASSWEKFRYRMSRHPLIFITAYAPVFLWGMCFGSFLKHPKKYWDSLLALIVHFLLVWFLWYRFGFDVLLLSSLLPLMITCSIGAYLFYIQHNYPGVQMKKREEWDYLFAALHSSSYLKGGYLLHWLTGNIGFHHIHHLNASIPFYRLPEAMKNITSLQKRPDTSLRPSDILCCLKLKLWDPNKKTMVGFPS